MGGIPKIRGLGKDGGVQPCILGMSRSTYGLKPEDNIHEEKVIMNLDYEAYEMEGSFGYSLRVQGILHQLKSGSCPTPTRGLKFVQDPSLS
jgi:hypothetical protein